MEKKTSINRKSSLKNKNEKGSKIENIILKIWKEDLQASRINKFFNRIIRILVVSVNKFIKDESLLWTSAISYSAVISFVPTVIAVLMFGAALVNIDVVFGTFHEQLNKLGLDVDLYQYKEPIEKFLDTAAKVIGGIGIFITVWSATNVFRNLESALNFIWKVKNTRPILMKIAQFVIALLFGLPMLLLALTITNSILNSFRAPDIEKLMLDDTKLYAIGTKGHISYMKKIKKVSNASLDSSLSSLKFTKFNIPKKLDYLGQDPTWFWNLDLNREAIDEEKENNELPTISKKEIQGRTVIAALKTSHGFWIVYDSGVILRKRHNTWYMQKYGLLKKKESSSEVIKKYNSEPLLFSTAFSSGKRIILAAQDGIIIFSDNFAKSWKLVKTNTTKRNILEIKKGSDGVLWGVGENNLLIKSKNNGEKWKSIKTLDRKLKLGTYFNYNTLYLKGKSVYVGANSSHILISHDNGKKWKNRLVVLPKIARIDIRGIYFKNKREGFVVGSKGFARYTRDGGLSWQPVSVKNGMDFTSAVYFPGTGFISSGPKAQIHYLTADSRDYRLNYISSEDRTISIIGNILNFGATFMVIWLLFLLVYIWLPYTKVSFKAASIGAGFTAIVWVAFIFLFTYYANNLAGKTMAIYGALAAIPLGLLLVYTSVAITLLGAEIAYVIQYPLSYNRPEEIIKLEESTDYVWYAFLVLLLIHHDHKTGKSPTPKNVLLEALNNDADELEKIIAKFKDLGMVKEDEAEQTFLPLQASTVISLDFIFDEIHNKSLDIPGYTDKNPAMRIVNELFQQIAQTKKDTLKGLYLEDILKKYGN
jgi:membrane protein